MSDSLQPHELQATRLLCPWDFLSKNTGVGCHFLFQQTVIFNNWEEASWDHRITEKKNTNSLEPKASLKCLMKACHQVKCLDQEVNKTVL